jgi:hypothetical protein
MMAQHESASVAVKTLNTWHMHHAMSVKKNNDPTPDTMRAI